MPPLLSPPSARSLEPSSRGGYDCFLPGVFYLPLRPLKPQPRTIQGPNKRVPRRTWEDRSRPAPPVGIGSRCSIASTSREGGKGKERVLPILELGNGRSGPRMGPVLPVDTLPIVTFPFVLRLLRARGRPAGIGPGLVRRGAGGAGLLLMRPRSLVVQHLRAGPSPRRVRCWRNQARPSRACATWRVCPPCGRRPYCCDPSANGPSTSPSAVSWRLCRRLPGHGESLIGRGSCRVRFGCQPGPARGHPLLAERPPYVPPAHPWMPSGPSSFRGVPGGDWR